MARRIWRIIGMIGLGLVGLVILLGLVLYGVSEARLNTSYDIAVTAPAIPTDPATVERGRHLVNAVVGCAGCHGPNLGGSLFADAPPFRLVAPNLTTGAGGIGSTYSDADWVRAIRHGVRPGGTPLLFMPSKFYSNLSDDDLGAVLAYLKSAPPVNNAPGTSELRPLGRALLATGQYQLPAATINHAASPQPAPPQGRSATYGQYLVAVAACAECHSPNLSGAPFDEPGAPPAANLTPGGRLGGWSEAQFIQAMRTGLRPDGSPINPAMPWKLVGQQTDDELGAIYRYLKSLPALSYNTPAQP